MVSMCRRQPQYSRAFAHEIRLSNLGNLPYGTEFGGLKLQALWGLSVSARFEGALNTRVATTNGALCLLETRVGSSTSLLETAEQILLSALHTRAGSFVPFTSIPRCSTAKAIQRNRNSPAI
jgi:hypothetical protein